MIGRDPKILPHEHSLKLRPHKHTSYAALAFLLTLTTLLTVGYSLGVSAAVQNPQTGSLGLTGTVPGPPPTQPAIIGNPSSGDHTSSSPITVSGTCPSGTFVFIEKNGVFGGQTNCTGGHFSLQVDLFVGANQLVGRVVDGLGQYGPDSAPVSVFYDLPASVVPATVVGRQLFLDSDETVVAGNPNTKLSRTVKIIGGTAPYAVAWDFGDGATSLTTMTTEGPVSASHSYASPGTYRVLVRVSDAAGNAAFIQLVTVVNGAVAAVSSGTTSSTGLPGRLVAAWPLLILAVLLVLAFWLGERRQQSKIARRQQLGMLT